MDLEFELNNKVLLPALGFGTYQLVRDVEKLVNCALEAGYRCIDTAAVYGNEREIGRAVRSSALKRQELFVITKVWNSDQGKLKAPSALKQSLENLGLDFVDLYLVHWPVRGLYVQTYEVLLRSWEDKLCRSLGVSNFQEHHLKEILAQTGTIPQVNQIELHPYLNQLPLRDYCRSQGIQVQAWSPLARGRALKDPQIQAIAAHHGKTAAQVVLCWELQQGLAAVPKSATPQRIRENWECAGFALEAAEMARIARLNQNRRLGPDPDNFNF